MSKTIFLRHCGCLEVAATKKHSFDTTTSTIAKAAEQTAKVLLALKSSTDVGNMLSEFGALSKEAIHIISEEWLCIQEILAKFAQYKYTIAPLWAERRLANRIEIEYRLYQSKLNLDAYGF